MATRPCISALLSSVSKARERMTFELAVGKIQPEFLQHTFSYLGSSSMHWIVLCKYSSDPIVFLSLYLCMYQLLSFAMPPLCQTQRRPFERWKFMVTGHWIRPADIWSHEWPHTLCFRVGSLHSIVVLLCLGTRCIVVLLCLGIVLLYSRGYPSTLCCIVVLLCLGTAYI